MSDPLDALEDRVALVTEGLARMRSEIARLERALAARPPAGDPEHGPGTLAAQNRLLLGERDRIRDRVRELIAEIDRAL